MISVKRVYAPFNKSDGYRILVDRLWPRGVSKAAAHLDLWLRDIGPSDALRQWFAHDPAKWSEFKKKYRVELHGKKALLDEIRALEKTHSTVTLLYGAKDEVRNQAIVLQEVLK